MNVQALSESVELFRPHVIAVALIGARLVPVAFLCPLLGGSAAPQAVKLGLVLSLALGLHLAGGVGFSEDLVTSLDFAAAALRELMFGLVLGLIAALPFDAARMGGRFIDLFRGTSAEAVLPQTGTREAATGDGLYQLLTALAMSGVALPTVLSSRWRTFGSVPLGTYSVSEGVAMTVVKLVLSALAAGLALGAPIAAVSLGVDCLLGLFARAAPQLHIQDTGTPVKILGGAAVLWLCIGLVSERALQGVTTAAELLASSLS
ncbi:MAG: EscT/YscT/HrcT family type III secretion system export apparatus protein [Myxococcaceae bacterium]